MKLKKIASLALAGIMAVSLLAGCKSNPADPENPTNPETTTGIVAAFNDGQSATNDVKVTFTSDSEVAAAMTSALNGLGDSAKTTSYDNLTSEVNKYLGKNKDLSMTTVTAEDPVVDSSRSNYNLANADSIDGKIVSAFAVFRVDSVLSANAAAKNAAKQINNDVISKLPSTTFEDGKMKDGDKYADYSYTGTVDMVSVQNSDGTTSYYVGYTITRTATVSTFEK